MQFLWFYRSQVNSSNWKASLYGLRHFHSWQQQEITWLMDLLTKAPTFRTKMVSKTSWGETRPSLLFDTVSVSSLEKKGNVDTHSETTAESS